MSEPRSRPAISPAKLSSTCASPAPPRSRTIASRPIGSMRLPPKPLNLAGPTIASSSSMRISGSLVRALLRERASPASPPKWRLPGSVSCSASKCHGSLATMPTGTASSTSPGSPTR